VLPFLHLHVADNPHLSKATGLCISRYVCLHYQFLLSLGIEPMLALYCLSYRKLLLRFRKLFWTTSKGLKSSESDKLTRIH